MSQMQIQQREGYLLVRLFGELVMAQSGEIKEQVKAALAGENPQIIIDMKDVEFIDSSGLGVLIAWFKAVNQKQGKIVFANISQYVKRIIDLAKLDKILLCADSLETAEKMLC